MTRKIFLIALIVVGIQFTQSACAQTPTPYVLLCLAAHPDDEDGATLAYYHEKYGVQTNSVFFTRGDGGQNEIGPELYKDLAVIRTRETENASRVVGSHAYFLNFSDFGYSKTAEETYRFWGGRDEVLRRLVLMIRIIKPDVIMTNHHTWLDNGENHGNHQVVALAALEAMDAAADSTFHPEQFKLPGVAPWHVHKLFMRAFDYNDTAAVPEVPAFYSSKPDVMVPVGEEFPGTHVRYQALANTALREHHTQGMEFFQAPVKPDARIWYKLMQADANYSGAVDNMFNGLIPEERTDAGKISSKNIPEEFTSLKYLDAVQPKMYPPQSPHVAAGKLVGIIQSYDNTMKDALTEMHVPYQLLDSSTITSGDLKKYSTIIIDIRAYGKRRDLVAANQRLLAYTVNGGNLVVFYQKTMDWKPEYAPFPLTLTRKRITDENSQVGELLPNDSFFHSPNEITDLDWKGWIVERGLYFPAESRDYKKFVAMVDPGESPLMTGLLRARYGNGTYWYCALSLYRQLRQNHPGAYKLFANLISYQTQNEK